MKKTPIPKFRGTDEMRKEYRFDYSKARPNRFAMRKKERLIVVLDPDVSKFFETPEGIACADGDDAERKAQSRGKVIVGSALVSKIGDAVDAVKEFAEN